MTTSLDARYYKEIAMKLGCILWALVIIIALLFAILITEMITCTLQ